MKFQIRFVAVVFYLLTHISLHAHTASDTLQGSSLKPFGRYSLTSAGHVELISSASHIGFSFIGKKCEVFVYITDASGHNYIQYELDGGYQKRIKISGNSKQPLIITASSNGTHKVWIYKATEAHTGPVFIEKIAGKEVRPLSRTTARTPLIEFIGNSITCGAAADPSEVPCGTGVYHDQHNAYYAYGPRVARALNSNFVLSSVSGIGIYRNWNSNGPTMPQVYEKSDFHEGNDRLWDFKTYSPDVVSIALGTNDFSGGDGKRERLPFDSATFVSNYITFIQSLKSKYLAAQIALLSSAMVHGNSRTKLQNCLTAVKQNIDRLFPADKPVALHFFKPMQARGCTGHPSVEDHASLAEELTPFFKKLLTQQVPRKP